MFSSVSLTKEISERKTEKQKTDRLPVNFLAMLVKTETFFSEALGTFLNLNCNKINSVAVKLTNELKYKF